MSFAGYNLQSRSALRTTQRILVSAPLAVVVGPMLGMLFAAIGANNQESPFSHHNIRGMVISMIVLTVLVFIFLFFSITRLRLGAREPAERSFRAGGWALSAFYCLYFAFWGAVAIGGLKLTGAGVLEVWLPVLLIGVGISIFTIRTFKYR